MLRFRTALLITLFVAIADAASKTNPDHYSPKLIIVVVMLGAWYISSTSVNDLADEEIDRINLRGNRERPLSNDQTNRKTLWLLAVSAGVAAMAMSIWLGMSSSYITLGAVCLGYVYSMPPFKLSHRGILAPIFLPIGYVAYPFLLTVFANNANMHRPQFWLLAGLYVSFIARIILKDFRDVKGDSKFGKRTFIVRHGAKATCMVSAVAWIAGTIILSLRFSSWPLLGTLLLPFTLAILYCLKWLSQEPRLKKQVQLVGLIGRLGNSAALLILVALYRELEPNKVVVYNALLVGVAILGASSAYSLYQPLISTKLKSISGTK